MKMVTKMDEDKNSKRSIKAKRGIITRQRDNSIALEW